MRKQAEGSLTAVFGALADPTRRGILARLAGGGECTVTQLGEPYKMSAPAISKHLGVLEQAGMIQRWKSGRVHYCRLVPAPLDEARGWIEQHCMFWQQQFDALADYLEQEDPTCKFPPPKEPPSPSGSGGNSRSRPPRSSRHGRSRRR